MYIKVPTLQTCTVDFKKAEDIGYFKLDISNVNVYDSIQSIEELDELLAMEPMWELLEHEDVVKKCLHTQLFPVKKMKPKRLVQPPVASGDTSLSVICLTSLDSLLCRRFEQLFQR